MSASPTEEGVEHSVVRGAPPSTRPRGHCPSRASAVLTASPSFPICRLDGRPSLGPDPVRMQGKPRLTPGKSQVVVRGPTEAERGGRSDPGHPGPAPGGNRLRSRSVIVRVRPALPSAVDPADTRPVRTDPESERQPGNAGLPLLPSPQGSVHAVSVGRAGLAAVLAISQVAPSLWGFSRETEISY